MSRLPLERKVLNENDRIAAGLRERFQAHATVCLNFIGSPGSGKTSLLERTLEGFHPRDRVAVLTGDIQTDNDAARFARYGFPVKQITTGGTCHLNASMIARALEDWPLEKISLLLIENVGNLVCPASYDLGEAAKVVLLSVTEGEDKPLKYPGIFFKSRLMVITKMDLLPHVPFDLAAAEANARRINPEIEIIKLSCLSRQGMPEWQMWLQDKLTEPSRQEVAADIRST
ncbi:MAG: hydrogenase nickel incorporation protein HypB [Candidatus Acidiferrales bacterium]